MRDEGRPKKFKEEELKVLLVEDCNEIYEEFAEPFGATQAAISKHRRFYISEMLIEPFKNKLFWKWIK